VRALPALLLLAGLAGCRGTELEDSLGKVAWFSNMRDQAAVEPFEEAARMPPEGTVHAAAGVPLMALPDDYTDIANPEAVTAESLEIGQENFPRGLINRLDSQRATDLSDGYIFGMMSTGRGLMPNYRRVPQEDRWHIVNYVRQLQESSGGTGN
jgi:hypothetical protein